MWPLYLMIGVVVGLSSRKIRKWIRRRVKEWKGIGSEIPAVSVGFELESYQADTYWGRTGDRDGWEVFAYENLADGTRRKRRHNLGKVFTDGSKDWEQQDIAKCNAKLERIKQGYVSRGVDVVENDDPAQ